MDYEAMGRRIRAFRKEQGMTQAELAESVGISTSFMGHIERGSRVSSLETMLKLSETLNVTLDMLVTGKEPSISIGRNASHKMRVLNDVLRVLNEHSGEWLRNEG
ncbi:MAG: helix-turn-helix domain-containing protein [Firmicutes bacterium]|nr:helix-turn-helix domain-containing protein [Bacillota bacterium]